VNDIRATGTLTQITQKTNEDASWREISVKKRNQKSFEVATTRKQLNMSRHKSSKVESTINFFQDFKKNSAKITISKSKIQTNNHQFSC